MFCSGRCHDKLTSGTKIIHAAEVYLCDFPLKSGNMFSCNKKWILIEIPQSKECTFMFWLSTGKEQQAAPITYYKSQIYIFFVKLIHKIV